MNDNVVSLCKTSTPSFGNWLSASQVFTAAALFPVDIISFISLDGKFSIDTAVIEVEKDDEFTINFYELAEITGVFELLFSIKTSEQKAMSDIKIASHKMNVMLNKKYGVIFDVQRRVLTSNGL